MPQHLQGMLVRRIKDESKHLSSKKLEHKLECYGYKIIKGYYRIIMLLNVSLPLEIQVSKSQTGKTKI